MDWQILEADEFFTNQKSVTSDHTLSRLRQPLLAEKQLHQLLRDMTLSHKQAVYNLSAEYTHFFTKWMFALRYIVIHISSVMKFQLCVTLYEKTASLYRTLCKLVTWLPCRGYFLKNCPKNPLFAALLLILFFWDITMHHWKLISQHLKEHSAFIFEDLESWGGL